ncbi:MAG: cytochrome P450, partial [Chloroflexota bacterium]
MTPVARPNNIPILHDYLDFRADPLRFWLDVGRMGPIVRVQLGPARSFWVVTDADLFKEILLTKSKNYPRDRQIRNGNGIDGGNTVFNAQTYEEWRWRRRLLQPGFHRKELAKFAETMVAETERLAAELLDGDIVDLTKLMKKLTMRIICQTMFSASLEETDQLQEAFETSSEFSYSQMSAVVKTPVWLPTPMVQRTKAAVSTKYEVLGRIVDERLASGQPKGDMLDMLISTQLTQEDADEAMPGTGRSF